MNEMLVAIDGSCVRTLPKMPMNMSQPAQAKPAEREAHLVSEMMPLF